MADLLLVIQAQAMKNAAPKEWEDWFQGEDSSARMEAFDQAFGIPKETPPDNGLTIPTGMNPSLLSQESYDSYRLQSYLSIFDSY